MSRETRPSSEEDAARVVISQDYSVEHGYDIKLGGRWFAHCKEKPDGTRVFKWKSSTHLVGVEEYRMIEQSFGGLAEVVLGKPVDFEKPVGLLLAATIKHEDERFTPKEDKFTFTLDIGKRNDFWRKVGQEGYYRKAVSYIVEDAAIIDRDQKKSLTLNTRRDPFDTRMRLYLSKAVDLSEDVITWIADHSDHTLEEGEALAISSTLLENFSKEPMVNPRKYL